MVIDSRIEIDHCCGVLILKQHLGVVVCRVDYPLHIGIVIKAHLLGHSRRLHDARCEDVALSGTVDRASRQALGR
jgi:hypothetical protein